MRLEHIYGLGEKTSIAYLHIHACYSYYNCYYLNNYISLKKDRSLKEAHTLVVDMCTGQMRQPKIPHNTIYY